MNDLLTNVIIRRDVADVGQVANLDTFAMAQKLLCTWTANILLERPEDTPHFLNPEALREDRPITGEAEEHPEEPVSAPPAETATEGETDSRSSGFGSQSPEKMEAVLNSGMQFLGGLLEMATGKKLEPAADDKPLVRIDRETGEVTLKFRLPV